jgi:uncharacterized protein (DUF2345 family)
MAATCTLKLSNHSTSPPNNRIREFQRFPIGESADKQQALGYNERRNQKGSLNENKKQEKNTREPPQEQEQQQQQIHLLLSSP